MRKVLLSLCLGTIYSFSSIGVLSLTQNCTHEKAGELSTRLMPNGQTANVRVKKFIRFSYNRPTRPFRFGLQYNSDIQPQYKPRPDPEPRFEPRPSVSLHQRRAIRKLKYKWERREQEASGGKRFVANPDLGNRKLPIEPCLFRGTFERQGNCKFLAHCPLDYVLDDYDAFWENICYITNIYVGVCCPNSEKPFTGKKVSPVFPTEMSPKLPVPVPTVAFPSEDCGESFESRIVGGQNAVTGAYPWMAALLRKSSLSHYCGAALVSPRHVLTAAHCLHNIAPYDVVVRLGAYDLEGPSTKSAMDRNVINIMIHPGYVRASHVHDMAILTLDKEVDTRRSHIRSICVAPMGPSFKGKTATVVGWGAIAYGGPSKQQLQEVQVTVWPTDECDKAFSQQITSVFLCAGEKGGGKDSCQGDSGGPLMVEGEKRRWMIIGLVSWGLRCGDAGVPGVYTRVNDKANWQWLVSNLGIR